MKKINFVNFIKTKRSYIVLALCILTVCGTYMLLSYNPATLPKEQNNVQIHEAPESEPLPDLADYFPPELEPKALEEKNANKQSSAVQDAPAAPASAKADNIEKAPMEYSFPVNGEIIKPYSGDTLVYSKTMSDWRAHGGTDIAAESGTDVTACADGVIESVTTDDRMGITIVIDHQNGVKSTYANLSNGMLVTEGQAVKKGEIISSIGNSALYESAEESHLHFEMSKNGVRIDPAAMLK